MSKTAYPLLCTFLFVVAVVSISMVLRFEKDVNCADQKSLADQRYRLSDGFQTSARYLSKMAKLNACMDPKDSRKQLLHALIKDLEIKAGSYAFLNKVFFLASLIFAVCILAFPIIHSATEAQSKINKIFNPAQLPAITLLAGLCFALYTDYKGKQTSTENLMRYAYTSTQKVDRISKTIREGLAEIDSGYDFSNLVNTND